MGKQFFNARAKKESNNTTLLGSDKEKYEDEVEY
jgi:hypothetical protein